MDVTIADPVNPRHISSLRTATVPLAAAKAAHQGKLKKFRTASNRQPAVDFAFQPLAFELAGAMGYPKSKKLSIFFGIYVSIYVSIFSVFAMPPQCI